MNNDRKMISYENIFIIIFSIYEIYNLLNITMFYEYLPQSMTVVFLVLAIGLVALRLVYNTKCSYIEFAWTISILFSMLVISYLSGYRGIVIIFCFIIAAQNMSMDRIVRTYFRISFIIMSITILAAKLEIIENVVWSSSTTGIVRYGFGYIYPTDFVSCIFFLVCAYIFLKREEKFSFFSFAVMLGIAYVTYSFCNTRLDSLCIAIAAFTYMFLKIRKEKPISKIWRRISYFSIPLFAGLSIWTTMQYRTSNPFMLGLNVLLSSRLYYGKQGIQRYGFSLFGQYVAMRGHSVKSEGVVSDFFYLDCSYLNIALRYGIVCLIIVCALLVFFMHIQYKKEDRVVPAIIILIGLNSMIAHHLFDGYTNIFLFVVLANTSFGDERRSRIRLPKISIKHRKQNIF